MPWPNPHRHGGGLFPIGARWDDGETGFGQLDADLAEHAHGLQPGLLALRADAERHMRGAKIRGIRKNFGQPQHAVLALVVGDGEAGRS